MTQSELFPLPEPMEASKRPPTLREQARVLKPNRRQVRLEPRDLDSILAEDHPARVIWDLVERLDLSDFYSSIKAVLDGPGRPAADPQVLLGLWVLAASEDVGSARELARLCHEHDAYRWLRGEVPVNYHMLADFRSAKEEELDALLTQLVAVLMAADVVPLECVAQDGMRVRASAGAASFRRQETLAACLEAARVRVAESKKQPDQTLTKRQQAARERAARERLERVERAMACLPEIAASKAWQQKKYTTERRARLSAPRASTTDPDARVMKMPDGGFRPAYNLQLATDAAHGIIVGVSVTAAGSDAGQAAPMAEQVERRCGQRPRDYLVDGGFAALKDITSLTQQGISVYAPVRLPKSKPEEERYLPRYGDTPEVIGWRERMSTEAGKAIYRQRSAVAEWANAQVRQHGVSEFNLRGLSRVTSFILLVAITHNLLRWASITT